MSMMQPRNAVGRSDMTTSSFDGGPYHPIEGMRLSQEQRNALIEALDNSAPKVFELEHLAVPTTGDPLHVRRNIRGQRPEAAETGTSQAAKIRNSSEERRVGTERK